MRRICKYCGEKIRLSNSQYNPGWRHVETLSIWCRIKMAEPKED